MIIYDENDEAPESQDSDGDLTQDPGGWGDDDCADEGAGNPEED